MNYIIKKVDKLFLFFVIYTVIFLVFFKTLGYTLPFVLAVIFALILGKPTKFLIKKFKMNSAISSITTTLIFFAVISFIVSGAVYSLTHEVVGFAKNAQVYILQNTNNIHSIFDEVNIYYNNLDPSIVNAIEKNISSGISKLSNATVSITSSVLSFVVSIFSSIPYIMMLVVFTVLSTYYFTKDMTLAKEKMLNLIPSGENNKVLYSIREARKMILNYIISYLIIILVTLLVTLVGFTILGVKYTITLSILSAILDIMPVLGISAVYLPVASIYFFSGDYFVAIGILILFIIAFITRQIVEPKIVSSSLGIHPVAMLAALFIGLKANGFMGMIFCVFLVVSYNILNKVGILK